MCLSLMLNLSSFSLTSFVLNDFYWYSVFMKKKLYTELEGTISAQTDRLPPHPGNMSAGLNAKKKAKLAINDCSVDIFKTIHPAPFSRVIRFYRPLLSVDEDLTASDVHPVPRQSQTQLVGSGSVGTWERREASQKVCFLQNETRFLDGHIVRCGLT